MKLFKALMIITIVGMNGLVIAGLSKKVSALIEQSKSDPARLAELHMILALIQQGQKKLAQEKLSELVGESSSSGRVSSSILSLDSSSDAAEEIEPSESSGDDFNPSVTAVMPILGLKNSSPIAIHYNSPVDPHYIDQFRMQNCEVKEGGSEFEWTIEKGIVDPFNQSLLPHGKRYI